MLQTSELHERGWMEFDLDGTAIEEAVLKIANALGTPVEGRGRGVLETISPRGIGDGPANSLSARYGRGVQPWHVDMAHRPTPPGLVLLACPPFTQSAVCTELFEWRQAVHPDWSAAAFTEPFLVRNGRRSFYATLLDRGRTYLRHDPGCMRPITQDGRALQETIEQVASQPTVRIRWTPGHVLIFDNWRVMHRRADATNEPDRHLLRIAIRRENDE